MKNSRQRKIKTFYVTVCGQDVFAYESNKQDAINNILGKVKSLTKKEVVHGSHNVRSIRCMQ